MVLTAGVMGDMDTSQVQLSPHLASFPTKSQLLIQKCLSAVLLQRLNLPCRLHTTHHLHYTSPSVLIASRLTLSHHDSVHPEPNQLTVCTHAQDLRSGTRAQQMQSQIKTLCAPGVSEQKATVIDAPANGFPAESLPCA